MKTQQIKNNQIKYLILYTMDGNLHIFKEENTNIAKKTFYKKLYWYFSDSAKNEKCQWDFLAQSEDNIYQNYAAMALIDNKLLVMKTKKVEGLQAIIDLIASSKLKRKKYAKVIEFLCEDI